MNEQQVLKRRENALHTVNRAIKVVDELYTGEDPIYGEDKVDVVLHVNLPADGIEVSGKYMKNLVGGLPDDAVVDVNKHQNRIVFSIKLI